MTEDSGRGDPISSNNEEVSSTSSPPRFSKSDLQRLRAVRLQLFEGAARGALIGGVAGGGVYLFVKHFYLLPLPKRFGFAVTTTASACVFAYIGAVVYGKNAIAEVGDVIRKADRRSIIEEVEQNRITPYRAELLNQERQVIQNMESSFERRAEAIRQFKASQSKGT